MPAHRPINVRFLEKFTINQTTGCWNWTGSKSRGYGYIGLNAKKNIAAHKFSYLHFVGPIPDGMLVLHSCNNSLCVNPNHLKLGTHSDNMADMKAAGRRIGRNTGSRLNAKELAKIARLLTEGHTQQAVADAVGVHKTTIQRLSYSGNLNSPARQQRRMTDERKMAALKMLKNGATVSMVAAEFGVDRKTIRNVRDKNRW